MGPIAFFAVAATVITVASAVTPSPPRRVYVANQADATISVIEAHTKALVATVDLRQYGFGDSAKPHHVQVEFNGSAWYVTLIGAGKVLKFNDENQLIGSADIEEPGLIALHSNVQKDLMFVTRSRDVAPTRSRMAVIRRSDMQVLAAVDLPFPRPHGITVHPQGERVYVASLGTNQVASIGVERKDVTIIDVPGETHGFVHAAVSLNGRWLALVAESADQLTIFDLADPVTPKLVRQVPMPDGPVESVFTVDSRWLFVSALRANQVAVVDTTTWSVTDTVRGQQLLQPHSLALSQDGRYVFVSTRHRNSDTAQQATGPGVLVAVRAATRTVEASVAVGYNAAGVGTPAPTASLVSFLTPETPLDLSQTAPPVTGAMIKCAGGKAQTFECENIDLVSHLPTSALGGTFGLALRGTNFVFNDIWGWTDAKTGREFALVGRVDGTAFVEVTDPVNPKYVGELPLPTEARSSFWRDIKVYKDHAFVVADNASAHGMQVFDLTQLRNVDDAPTTFQETARYTGIHSAHNVIIDEATGYAYIVNSSGGGETCGGGLHMIDIRDPQHPTFAGCHVEPRAGARIHDAQCVVYRGPDSNHRGKEICLNSAEKSLSIVDVTDKRQPTTISVARYPNVAYAHQGWLSEDHRYFFLNDELDEQRSKHNTRTIVFDLQDLDDPVVIREFFGTTAATDHNLYVRGKYAYQAHYKAGLRILDVSDPARPKEVGYFDTTPHMENTPGYAGAWSSYPYFKSGVIAVNSIGEGLFMLRFTPPTSGP